MEALDRAGLAYQPRLNVVGSRLNQDPLPRKVSKAPRKQLRIGLSATVARSLHTPRIKKQAVGGSSTQAIVVDSDEEDDKAGAKRWNGREGKGTERTSTLHASQSPREEISNISKSAFGAARQGARPSSRKRRQVVQSSDSEPDSSSRHASSSHASPARPGASIPGHLGRSSHIRTTDLQRPPERRDKGKSIATTTGMGKTNGYRSRRESSPLESPSPTPSSVLISPPPTPKLSLRRYSSPLPSPESSPDRHPAQLSAPFGQQKRTSERDLPSYIDSSRTGVFEERALEVVQVIDSDDDELDSKTWSLDGTDDGIGGALDSPPTLAGNDPEGSSSKERATIEESASDPSFPGQACYFCSDQLPNPLPPGMYAEMLTLSIRGTPSEAPNQPQRYNVPLEVRRDFCIKHRRASRYAKAAVLDGYPGSGEIDWQEFAKRLEDKEVRSRVDRCCRVPDRSLVYKRIQEECEAWGKARWEEEYKRGTGLGKTHAGYYGSIGRTIIQHHLQNLLRWGLLPCMGRDVLPCAPFTSDEFIAHVLVLEVALSLIQQDVRARDHRDAKEVRAEARRIWQESCDYGQHTFPADGEEVEDVERWMANHQDIMRKDAVYRRVEDKRRQDQKGRSAHPEKVVPSAASSRTRQEPASRVSRMPLKPSQEMSSQDSVLGSQEDWLANMAPSQLFAIG